MKAAVLKLIWKFLGRKELTINKEKCIVCGKCYKTCHHNAIEKGDAERSNTYGKKCNGP